MNNLEALLRRCTVLIRGANDGACGSGFFIAPGVILTAAHVLGKAGTDVSVQWDGRTVEVLDVEGCWPDRGSSAGWKLPDIAVLRVSTQEAAGHPCVKLLTGEPGEHLLAEGYTVINGDQHSRDSVPLRLVTVRSVHDDEHEYAVLKCREDAVIDDGMSGGPVLDLQSGEVAGLVKNRRVGPVAFGGNAVAIDALRQLLPDAWTESQRFHLVDRRWDFARRVKTALPGAEPRAATVQYLALVRETVRRRPAFLPAGGSMADILQVPSVRTSAGRPGDTGTPVLSSDTVVGDLGARREQPEGVLQWVPLRTPWQTVVLTGLPGLGKSFLVGSHADAVARDGQDRLETGESEPLSIKIPVLVDCAAFATALPRIVDQDGVLTALVKTIRESANRTADTECTDAIVRLAHEEGRLITCLDGLDEVDRGYQGLLRQALGFLATANNQLIVTSRPYRGLSSATDALKSCFRAEVIGFTAAQVLAFVRAWFSRPQGEQRRAVFEAAMQDREELRFLARVPLLGALLCRLAEEGETVTAMPASAAALYDAVIRRALAGRWRQSRTVVDPEMPPSPALRLNVLAGALGELSRSWRARVDRFTQSALVAALREQPDYEAVDREASARWDFLQQERGTVRPHPPVPALWEYQFDGLVVADLVDAGEPTMRFAHPVLAEYCIAADIAGKDDAALRRAVEEHRWFDPQWHEIWPLAAALIDDPNRLIVLFADGDAGVDSWFNQTLLAGRCIVRSGRPIHDDLLGRVLTRLTEALRSPSRFDRSRSAAVYADLIRARIPVAVDTADRLIEGSDIEIHVLCRLIAALAEIGDVHGLQIVRRLLAEQELSPVYRAWWARSVVIARDREGIEALYNAVRTAKTYGELHRLVAAIPVEGTVGSDLTERILRDHNIVPAIRAAAGRALVRIGEPRLIKVVKEIVDDSLTVWTLRAALVSELLTVGEDDVIPVGHSLAEDPNLPALTTAVLVDNLVRRGEASVLPKAAELLRRADLHWTDRDRLAVALAELGAQGTDELRRQVDKNFDLGLKVSHLLALIGAADRSAVEKANRLVEQTGTLGWIRTRLAVALLERSYLEGPIDHVRELASEPANRNIFQPALIAALAACDPAGAATAAQVWVRSARKQAGHQYTGSDALIESLTESGTGGQQVLHDMALDDELAEEDRALAVIALAGAAPDLAEQVAATVLGQLTGFVRSRLAIALADKGISETADEVITLLDTDHEAYRALHRLLASPRASRDLVRRVLPHGSRSHVVSLTDSQSSVVLDDDFLHDAGLTWSSDTERDVIASIVWNTIEQRVAAKIAVFTSADQQEELAELLDARDRNYYLAGSAAGYRELFLTQMKIVQEELRAAPFTIHKTLTELDGIELVTQISSLLSEWVAKTRKDGRAACASFLKDNCELLCSQISRSLLVIAAQATETDGIRYEGHRFLLSLGNAQRADNAARFITDSDYSHNVFTEAINAGDGHRMLSAACAELLFPPGNAVAYFYGGIGAAIVEADEFAFMLLANSGAKATDRQARQAERTIADQGRIHGWSEQKVAAMIAAFRSRRTGSPG